MSDHINGGCCRDLTASTPDHRHQLSDRVLSRNRIVEQCRVQRPAGLAVEHPGRCHDITDGVEDPFRPLRLAELVAPQRQHRRMEALIVERETGGDLPTQIGADRLQRFTIRQPFE
jgi:hypothetical protein